MDITSAYDSCIMQGRLFHAHETAEVQHAFEYPLFMMYLNIDESQGLDRVHPLWSFSGKKNLFYYRRKDYLTQTEAPIRVVLSELLSQKGWSVKPEDMETVYQLSHLRYWGFNYNPVSFYTIHTNISKQQPHYWVVHIHNTPWNERYPYVFNLLEEAQKKADFYWFFLKKAFHVSPFYPMNLQYEWGFSRQKGKGLSVHMRSFQPNQKRPCFKAMLDLGEIPINKKSLGKLLYTYPCVSLKTFSAIYWQAAKLYLLKRAPFYTHPKKRT